MQSARGRGKRSSARPRVQPICADCNKEFKRIQEFKRHLKDKHKPPRLCPFCRFTWTRPDKIKAHIIANHWDIFAPEMQVYINALCGRQMVAFIDGYILDPYGHDLNMETTIFDSPVLQGSPLS
jgi:hypothetical protein